MWEEKESSSVLIPKSGIYFPDFQDCDTRGGDRKWRDIDLDRKGWLRLHQICIGYFLS